MNPWELTGQIIGWVVFALVVIIALAILVLLLIGFGVVLVSVAQQLIASVRTWLTRTKSKSDAP